MAKVEVVLPQMGEGIIEATITRWLVDVNTHIEEDDPLVEIATDKVDSEVPAPVNGVLKKQFFSEGEVPKVGDVIAIIDDGKAESNNALKNSDKAQVEQSVASDKKSVKKSRTPKTSANTVTTLSESKNISLFIKNFAQLRGVSAVELQQIEGSGKGGFITKDDIYAYIKEGRPFKNRSQISEYETSLVNVTEKHVEYQAKEGEEIVGIDRTRALIAQHMVNSVQTAPHVTSFVEVDVTAMVAWRNEIKAGFKAREGVNITYTPLIVQLVVKALKEFPLINTSLLPDNRLVIKKYINIGIATALPDGNLIVPVVKNADRLNLVKLVHDIYDKSTRARKGALKPTDTSEGTFTITNLGLFGNVTGTPIINQPESAILAVGAIKKKPGVVENNGAYTIGVRDVMTLALSYDHRIIDGALGGAFLTRIGELLEEFQPPAGI
jgi:2-oxoglutarate dehydrogenase E2 component (dihydrolipoamide succinyltransferase)